MSWSGRKLKCWGWKFPYYTVWNKMWLSSLLLSVNKVIDHILCGGSTLHSSVFFSSIVIIRKKIRVLIMKVFLYQKKVSPLFWNPLCNSVLFCNQETKWNHMFFGGSTMRISISLPPPPWFAKCQLISGPSAAMPPTWLGPLLLAWISNYIHYKVWDEITYPFLSFNGATVEV